MNKYISNIFKSVIIAGMAAVAVSCTDYLDKAPGSDIDENTPYQNFRNFQGFVEELYGALPLYSASTWHSCWNYGEDEHMKDNGNSVRFLTLAIDNGNYRCMVDENMNDAGDQNFYGAPAGVFSADMASGTRERKKNLWQLSWAAIRKANLGLANLDRLQSATQEERDLLKGQLLFFRGFYHHMLMQYWGGLPYIDYLISSSETPRMARLSYQECADRAAQDMQEAAELLPVDWDKTEAGRQTLGNNNFRANKIMALAFAGKCLLYAGSPLMNYESTGVRAYNEEYCKRAADLLGEALAITESTGRYELAPLERRSELFYYVDQGTKIPGLKEAILLENFAEFSNRWQRNMSNDYLPFIASSGLIVMPTANYVLNYGMANGEPIKSWTEADAVSGYDPAYPWKGRDPRFYTDISYDGVLCCKDEGKAENIRYAQLYTGGHWRTNANYKNCLTGLLETKFIPQANKTTSYQLLDQYTGGMTMALSLLRLSDLYLLYSEAAACGYGTPSGKSPKYNMTALDAVNKIRGNVGVPGIASRFTGSNDTFLPELYRERAVELAFEGHRFFDLRRWLLLTNPTYMVKTALEFDRTSNFNYNKPSEARVANLREEVIVQRNLDDRHYWLPLPTKDVNIYPEFNQNPGW